MIKRKWLLCDGDTNYSLSEHCVDYTEVFSFILQRYQDKFLALCQEMLTLEIKENEKRKEEISCLLTSIREAREDNKNQGVDCINEYGEYKKKV